MSKLLYYLRDFHDLIHKAVDWILLEVGKKDEMKLKIFFKSDIARCLELDPVTGLKNFQID